MRKVLTLVALTAVLAVVAVGGYALVRDSGDDLWAVGGVAEEPWAVADACSDVVPEGVGYATSSDGRIHGENVYSTVAGRDAAERVVACLHEHGAKNVEIAAAGPVKSFTRTGP